MSHFDAVLLCFANEESPQSASAIPASNATSARDQGPLTATSTTAKRRIFHAGVDSPVDCEVCAEKFGEGLTRTDYVDIEFGVFRFAISN